MIVYLPLANPISHNQIQYNSSNRVNIDRIGSSSAKSSLPPIGSVPKGFSLVIY